MKQFQLSLVLLGAVAAPVLFPLTSSVALARPANVAVRTPKAGSRERSAIMDALRVPVQKFHKGKKPTFTGVNNFRVGGGWAHLTASTIDSKGRSIGPDPEEPYMNLSALLKLEKGKWRVVTWAYHGDVIQIDWAQKYPSVPLNILGLKPSDLQ